MKSRTNTRQSWLAYPREYVELIDRFDEGQDVNMTNLTYREARAIQSELYRFRASVAEAAERGDDEQALQLNALLQNIIFSVTSVDGSNSRDPDATLRKVWQLDFNHNHIVTHVRRLRQSDTKPTRG